MLSGAASRALGSIISKTKNVRNCTYKTFTKMFDAGVKSIIEYGSGVWGFKPYKCENIRLRETRYFLGVNRFASIHAIEGDMGWEPIHIGMKLNMIRLWNKLIKMQADRIAKIVFEWEYNLGVNNWCSEIEQILGEINLGELFDRKITCDLSLCKERLFKEYQLLWENGKLLKPKLRTYNLFKNNFEAEHYVKYCDKYMRSHLAQLRSGILPLNIELGRHRGIKVDDRKCTLCNLDSIEDEFHFICKCPLYAQFRKELYDTYKVKHSNFGTLSDDEKFILIMKSANKQAGRYIVNSFDTRRKSLYK